MEDSNKVCCADVTCTDPRRIMFMGPQLFYTAVYPRDNSEHVFGLCPWSNVSKSTTFRKLDLFPSSGKKEGAPIVRTP
jgi:hypothetical protein